MLAMKEPESSLAGTASTPGGAEDALQEGRRLTGRVVDAYERRQQLLAEQIHDCVAQHLLGALLHFQASERLEGDPEASRRAFGTAKEALGEAAEAARRLAIQLRPPLLDEFGIVLGIKHLICGAESAPGKEVWFVHPDAAIDLPRQIEIAIFRIVQELLANACRHSQAEKTRVELARDAGRLRIEVQDWGVGFDPANVGEGRFGLQDVRDRATLLGGRMTIDSAAGKGTHVVVEFPLPQEG
jgi:signal transduction histidine kinase